MSHTSIRRIDGADCLSLSVIYHKKNADIFPVPLNFLFLHIGKYRRNDEEKIQNNYHFGRQFECLKKLGDEIKASNTMLLSSYRACSLYIQFRFHGTEGKKVFFPFLEEIPHI